MVSEKAGLLQSLTSSPFTWERTTAFRITSHRCSLTRWSSLLLNHTFEALPDTHVFLSSISSMPDGGMNKCVLDFNDLLVPFIKNYNENFMDRRLNYVPIAEIGLCAAEPAEDAHECTMDHVHPISVGYMKMAAEFLYAILQHYQI